MNIENIKKVRDFIAALPAEKFDMDYRTLAEHPCGTACCIAGWAERIMDGSAYDTIGNYEGLFYPENFPMHEAWKAKPAHAVAVLDRLIETGEVDWDWAMANPADLSGASS